ncbi:ribosome rescue GTPase HflX [Nitrococcus mobilis]|uniref:GTPase HflX n=1 Tax=Nitrococcus mobilis Nb-231 TaxID=314278 RepID=A4BLP5_9GAMM|nr:ribosome rescue GTPase HflX [Nitrococcus mobilis]EAR23233.1 GTP-binding protein [Nitrococcus mobilis Nb-231]
MDAAPARLFARPDGGERAILVQLDSGIVDLDEAFVELAALAETAGAVVVDKLVNRRAAPDPRYFIGKGKVGELAARIRETDANLVLINHGLSAVQERNLEQAFGARVLDRTGLILDIFALRARSHEGKLQVELAQLRHIASRLVRGWSHLERQKGGIGLRGPGETQLELDRRLLGQRIKQLEKRLTKVRRQREQGRQARRKREFVTVSFVGYTNAGKSALFNRLTESHVYIADLLFATLDTTLRRIELPGSEQAIIADTVGFIRELPHQLIAAFRSTLEEVAQADLLLHVIDIADPLREQRRWEVERVLSDIGAGDIPALLIFNKLDLSGGPARLERDGTGQPVAVWVSAQTGEGMELLRAAIAERIGLTRVHGRVRLSPTEGRLRARLYALGQVRCERISEQGVCELEVDLPQREWARLRRQDGASIELWPADH